MNKEEFMALSAEEMYNKYKTADEMWMFNLQQSQKKDDEIAILQKKIDEMKSTIKILGRML